MRDCAIGVRGGADREIGPRRATPNGSSRAKPRGLVALSNGSSSDRARGPRDHFPHRRNGSWRAWPATSPSTAGSWRP